MDNKNLTQRRGRIFFGGTEFEMIFEVSKVGGDKVQYDVLATNRIKSIWNFTILYYFVITDIENSHFELSHLPRFCKEQKKALTSRMRCMKFRMVSGKMNNYCCCRKQVLCLNEQGPPL